MPRYKIDWANTALETLKNVDRYAIGQIVDEFKDKVSGDLEEKLDDKLGDKDLFTNTVVDDRYRVLFTKDNTNQIVTVLLVYPKNRDYAALKKFDIPGLRSRLVS